MQTLYDKIMGVRNDCQSWLIYVHPLILFTTKKLIKKAYGAYLGLGEIVNITYGKIEAAYFNKNEVNFKRIENNY